MAKDNGTQNQMWNTSLEDEQRLRSKIYELHTELEILRSKPVRSEQEERRYEFLKSQYGDMYEEYAGKYSIVIETDRLEQPKDEYTRSSKMFKTLAVCLGVLVLLVTSVVVLGTINNTDGKRLAYEPNNYVKWDGEQNILGEGYKIAAESVNDVKANVLDADKRVPDLTKAQNTDQIPERRHFSWTAIDGATILTWNPQLYKETYEAYRNADRYLESDEFYRYISDANNERLILEIAHTLQSIGEGMGYSEWELASETVNFIQNIEFATDMASAGHEEWPKYVTETVYDECGDCEDKAFFLAGILKALGYDVVLVAFENHLGVGIVCGEDISGTNYEVNGKKYYYIEPSYPGWEIGQIPDTVDSVQVAIVPI